MKLIISLLFIALTHATRGQEIPLNLGQDLTARITVGPVGSIGHQLAKGYFAGLALEPSIIKAINEKIDVGGAVICNIFINNYSDRTRDHLILYGPLIMSGYKNISVKKISLEPLLGLGYLWGQDFMADRSISPTAQGYFSDRVSLLDTQGLYGRLGISIRLSAKTRVIITYNIHRPEVSLKEGAKQQFYHYSFNTSLYGNTMEFPSNKMNCDTVLIGLMLGL